MTFNKSAELLILNIASAVTVALRSAGLAGNISFENRSKIYTRTFFLFVAVIVVGKICIA
jgi:hypothetical protein